MAILYVDPEQILSCTVGQLAHNHNTEGVKTEELQYFCSFLLKNLRAENNKSSVFFDYPSGDTYYYGDQWREHFEYFMEKYAFTFDEIFYNRSEKTVAGNIRVLKINLLNEGLSNDQATTIIEDSISQFLLNHSVLQNKESNNLQLIHSQ